MPSNKEEAVKRIRSIAALCAQQAKEFIRREDAENGHVRHIKKLTGKSVPPGTSQSN